MPAPPPPPPETVTVLPAPPGADGVVCGIWRELTAPGPLPSIVPANVYACLNGVASGSVRLHDGQILPAAFVTGPMTRPLGTWAQGPLRSASVIVAPWLLGPWCDEAPDTLVDRWAPLRTPGLQGLLVQAAASPAALAQALQALVAQWPQPPTPPELQALRQQGSVGAASEALGLGERQFERRFRRVCGLTPRRWLALRAYEAALLRIGGSATGLAAVAAECGFADQAHMNRRFVDVAARTPAQARRALASQAPGHWPLRPAAAGDTMSESFKTPMPARRRLRR